MYTQQSEWDVGRGTLQNIFIHIFCINWNNMFEVRKTTMNIINFPYITVTFFIYMRCGAEQVK